MAKATYDEWEIADIPIGFNFSIEDARKWGLFISEGLEGEPDKFTEPGLYLVSPDQTLYWVSVQSMPFGRPSFDDVLSGIKYIQKEDYPARGEN